MRFVAEYRSIKPVDGKHLGHFTTIDADSEPEANKIAKQWTRKHWQLVSVKQQLYAVD
jgi:hypothetical protein